MEVSRTKYQKRRETAPLVAKSKAGNSLKIKGWFENKVKRVSYKVHSKR